MAGRQLDAVMEHIRHLANGGRASALTDQQLLERFIAAHDEAAFATLVGRHGPMILSLCRRLLHHIQDAEDVCQATFLVLARKAPTIRKQTSVGSWLYGVAYRLALKAKAEAAKRHTRSSIHRFALADQTSGDSSINAHRSARNDKSSGEPDPLSEITWREVCTALDEELARLPDRFRAPLVLCYLESKTQDEALQQLGWSKSTFRRRLEDGRTKLCLRLTRRGITLSAGLWATLLSDQLRALTQPGSPFLSSALAQSTVQAAIPFAAGKVAAGISPHVTLMAEKAVKAVVVTKLKWLAFLGIATAITTGLGLAAHQALTASPANGEPRELLAAADERRDQPKPQTSNQPRLDRYGDPLPEGATQRLGTLRLWPAGWAPAFSPDGKTFITCSSEEIRTWEVGTGNLLKRTKLEPVIPPLRTDARALPALSPDHKIIALAGIQSNTDEFIRLWDVASGKKIRDIACGPSRHIHAVSWSPDGKTLVGKDMQGTVSFWAVKTGKETQWTQNLQGTQMPSVAISADAKHLEVGDFQGPLKLFDLNTGKLINQVGTIGGGYAVSPDGNFLASVVTNTNQVKVWEIKTGKEFATWKGSSHVYLYSARFSPDGKKLAASGTTELVVWEFPSGRELAKFSGAFRGWTAFSPDGNSLAAMNGSSLSFFDLTKRKELHPRPGHYDGVYAMAFSPDGKILASSSVFDAKFSLWNVLAGSLRGSFSGHKSAVRAIVFSPDGKILLTGSDDDTLRFWDTTTGAEIRSLAPGDPKRQSQMIWHCRFSPDGQRLSVFGNSHGPEAEFIDVLDVATGKRLFTRSFPGADARYVAPDGQSVVLQQNQSHFLYDVNADKKIVVLPEEAGSWLTLSPDGKILAANLKGDGKGTALWEVVTGKRILSLPDVQTGFLAFSPDGRLLVTGAVAREGIRVLDVATGRQVFHWPAPEHFREDYHQYIHSMCISPNGRILATGLQDTTVVLWDLIPATLRLPPLSSDLKPDELAGLWTDLAAEDAAKAHRATWSLVSAASKVIPLFHANLKPGQPLDLKRVQTLITDLESNEFAVRETASQELKKLAYSAEAVLRKTLKSHPSVEVRRRIEAILALPAEVSSQEELRGLRAIQVLEHIGMREAQEVLKTLSQGTPDARLTQEAKASLERLAKRSAVSP